MSEAEREVVEICRDLIRIDTTNPGDGTGPGERRAAEHVAGLLAEVGLEPQLFESAPGRTSVVTRIEGDPAGTADRGALLLHGHLDVVPARADDWRVDPFAGEVTTERTADGEQEFLWGRGAVDMKDMDAMLLAVVRDLLRRGERPPRDVVLAFLADEEAGGVQGAHWLVDHHPGLFEGCTAAVSEVGGFSTTVGTGRDGRPAQRTYLLQTAEKGIAWLRLVAHGRAGHGSQVNTDNAVTRLCEAVARIGAHPWPVEVTPTVRAFLDGVTDITGVVFDVDDEASHARVLEQLGTTARWVGATLRDTANPTLLDAGYKQNVIPGTATALLDCRFLPGHEERLVATVRELAGEHVQVQDVHRDVALEAPYDVPLVERMVEALLAEDPGARVLPYCLSGGTDNKSFSQLGIPGYGFAPLRLPADLDFSGLFHGVDERVPLDALRFGVRVLDRFVRSA